jgi:quinol-cytochrome oxidoreductase complex cytochrome b subunit
MAIPNNPSPEKSGLFLQIWRSIFPDPLIPRSDQARKRYLLKNLILHFRPLTVPEKTLKFSLTWGLGGMAAVLVLLQFGTGVLLKFVYVPTPVAAYSSIEILQNEVAFGQLIRNLHHWSANLLVLIVFLHLLRVFFTGSFHPPRQFSWVIGLGLFSLVLIANFTGYLLPYDQLAYWAVTVSTGMLEYIPGIGAWLQETVRGGTVIGPASLRIFFALHTAVIPVALVILMGFHFWRIRRAGGLVIPRAPGEEIDKTPVRVASLPNLLLREAVVASVLVAAVILVSVFFNAPLGEPANPGLSSNPTKAPWYFAGLQEMLLHLHPIAAVFTVPMILAVLLLLLPYVSYDSDSRGIWFASHKGRRMAIVGVIAALIVTPFLIIIDDFAIEPGKWLSGLPPEIRSGLIPIVILLAAVIGFYFMMKWRFLASNNDGVQAVFVLMVVSLVVLTIVGVWFRGSGMELVWPL